MKSSAQEAYEKVQQKLLMAPGMIEESERRLLFKAAFNCKRQPIVEFGAFFGASTLALASGLSAGKENQNQIICIDAFEVDRDHSFHKHVIGYAKNCKAEKLLSTQGTKTNWIEITKAVLSNELKNVKLIKGIVNDSFDMSILPETIGLLHLDLPKDAKTIAPIVKETFPRLSKGSIIAFQDYAYQFSNELISFFELLEQKHYIKATSLAASSIFYEVCTDRMPGENLENLLKEAVESQSTLLRDAIKKYARYPNTRPQELIAMNAAAIRSTRSQKDEETFQQQRSIRRLIEEMTSIDSKRSAFVLSELLTETLEEHR